MGDNEDFKPLQAFLSDGGDENFYFVIMYSAFHYVVCVFHSVEYTFQKVKYLFQRMKQRFGMERIIY